jgi:hypothetical protein
MLSHPLPFAATTRSCAPSADWFIQQKSSLERICAK